MIFWLCVAARIVANPISNVLQKVLTNRSAQPLGIICVTHLLLTLACLPLLTWFPPPDTVEFWGPMSLCGVLCVAGNALIVQALQLSDLSVLGPINSYKTVISLIPGMLFLDERPGLPGLCGMALVVAGSYFLVDQRGDEQAGMAFARFIQDRGIQCRLAALVVSAAEAVFLKQALLASSAVPTFLCWSILGLVVSLGVVSGTGTRRIRGEIHVLRGSLPTCVMLSLMTGVMQLCTILVLAGMPVALALALFQTSTLLSVLLGYTIFREPHFAKRLTGSIVMLSGAALIVVSR